VRNLFKTRKFLVGIIVVALLAIPIAVYAQVDNHKNSSTPGTTVRLETLPSIEEAQQKVDFPIMVPNYLPENMKLAKRGVCYQGILGPFPSLNLMYQDLSDFRKGDIDSIKSISLHQRKYERVDIERIKEECENFYVEGKKCCAEIEIQGVIGFWTPYGTVTCEKPGDKSSFHLNSRRIRVEWWANGVRYGIIAHNVPPEEVLAFADSLTYLK
jgi:hypothetical protein